MIIYTDGSCSGNPGPGGFGVVVLDDKENLIECYSERCDYTTNNREELKAINWAMEMFGQPQDDWFQPCDVYSDSSYSVNTYNSWMAGWERNGWKKSDKKTPENLDLIQEYNTYLKAGYKINLLKVKGHADNKWNNLADALATGKITSEEAMKLYGGK
jgi:ribonuclease HI